MKISIAASILILLVAALFGIPQHQRLAAIRESHAKLTAAAAQLGIFLNPSQPHHPVLITKRERENKAAEAKLAAAELIAYSKETQAIHLNSGLLFGEQHLAWRRLNNKIMERMISLNPSQIKIVIAELNAAKDLKDRTRQNLIEMALLTLSNNHPQAAVELFTESSDLFENSWFGTHVVSSSLANWAKDDPLGALEWVKKTDARLPDFVTDEMKLELFSGAASKDPKLAFQLIGQLDMKDPDLAIYKIISAANTSQSRTLTLTALREYLAKLPVEKKENLTDNSFSALAYNIQEDGFIATTQWITESNLTPAELESFSNGLLNGSDDTENEKWIEWIGEKLPPEKALDRVNNFVRNWTHHDYQAVGKWLNTAADGPTKNTAIQSYAETISKVEPAAAARWAMTLPPGEDRNRTLTTIYQNWPDDNPSAKEAFKQEHGIK